MKQRILIVEDEPDLRTLVEYNLRREGYDTEAVPTARMALQAVAARRPDLVVLDLMLPDFPGTQVCRELKERRETRDIPILMLTAKGEEQDKVKGLELGADDYVVKPVGMRELALRVAAILRRGTVAAPPAAPGTAIRVDREAHQAFVLGQPVELTPLEFLLLAVLLERAGRVQTRERLLEEVFEQDAESGSRTLDTHVKRLRSKLGETGSLIETVRGVGYRLRRGV